MCGCAGGAAAPLELVLFGEARFARCVVNEDRESKSLAAGTKQGQSGGLRQVAGSVPFADRLDSRTKASAGGGDRTHTPLRARDFKGTRQYDNRPKSKVFGLFCCTSTLFPSGRIGCRLIAVGHKRGHILGGHCAKFSCGCHLHLGALELQWTRKHHVCWADSNIR